MAEINTFLQIDLQNLFFEAKKNGHKIDFEKIWDHFKNRDSEHLNEAIIYMVQGDDFDSSKFESKMLNIGYKIKYKKNIKNTKEKFLYRQINHDVSIAVDAVDKIKFYDKLILMSGGNDFSDLGKYLRGKNKKIEFWGFENDGNSCIESYADRIYYFSKEFFYKKPNISVFGFNKDLY